jgi:hypothetical protein
MGMTLPGGLTTVLPLLLLFLVVLLFGWFSLRMRKGVAYTFRRISAFEALRGLLGTVAEEGKRVHVSLGKSGIGGDQTASVSAGLAVLRYLADQGASIDASPIVTVADPSMLLVAQDTIYRAYEQRDRAASCKLTDVQMIAPDAAAYAAGAQDVINDEGITANVMVGNFGDEYLLMGEAGAQRHMVQVVGSNALNVYPFMVATSDHVLVGEELFATGAYLTDRPEHAASLRVQDVLRVSITIAILVGVVVKTLLG